MIIFKYPLEITDRQELSLPYGSRVLSAKEQDGILCVWVQLNEQGPPANYVFYIFGTGTSMQTIKLNTSYVDTVQMSSGLVWHLFYKTDGY
jgi:hypothetical protein